MAIYTRNDNLMMKSEEWRLKNIQVKPSWMKQESATVKAHGIQFRFELIKAGEMHPHPDGCNWHLGNGTQFRSELMKAGEMHSHPDGCSWHVRNDTQFRFELMKEGEMHLHSDRCNWHGMNLRLKDDLTDQIMVKDEEMMEVNNGNLIVKGLDNSVTNLALFKLFPPFGEIRACKVAIDSDGRSKGYGFVQFYLVESAKKVVKRLNETVLNGNRIIVVPLITKKDRETTSSYPRADFKVRRSSAPLIEEVIVGCNGEIDERKVIEVNEVVKMQPESQLVHPAPLHVHYELELVQPASQAMQTEVPYFVQPTPSICYL